MNMPQKANWIETDRRKYMNPLPFEPIIPIKWPAWICWIVEQARMEMWVALGITVLVFLLAR